MAGVVHAYERPLPISKQVISDFYLPSGKVYIQFWGTDSAPIAEDKRIETRETYEEHGFSLIELTARRYPKPRQRTSTIIASIWHQGVLSY